MTSDEKKQVVLEFMKKHGYKTMPLYWKGNSIGELTSDYNYKDGLTRSLNKYHAQFKIILADVSYESMKIIQEVLDLWNKPMEVVVVWHDDYKPKEETTWTGTFDEICDKMDKANNSYRYCNGNYYKIKDSKLESLRHIWHDLIPFQRSFNNFYLGSYVD